ncbi:unnamed protein product [Adineta steineri]|uniref:POU domain protein n=1 Tax=Adineta steineri TaxID=433720 RepID=A0A818SWX9_9BILA|nr:unnamed protein product [Adineta steineri]CAF1298530.1 unnamed protein product [Adineta steineri]CAF3671772.1 unnamed protein product [Adineta steineri]CAF3740195.1 unnamed protein product [Adineta steineri]CAF3953451.1 unnamed protein product [Adineta steineri]
MNPFYSSFLSHLTSQQQQQQLLLTQFLLSGATCPPVNPLANALQFLLHNSALFLQQQNLSSSLIDSNKPNESISPVNLKHKHDLNISVPIDCSLSDTNGKSTLDDDDNSPTIATTLATLPNNNETTTIDGINLEEIKQFAKIFKLRRLALGLTQTQVGQALSVTRGPAYSQSAICRFEKLDITPKSASKIKPVLEKWMREAELKYADRLKNGPANLQDLVTDLNTRKRKRRTSFTPQALEKLNDAFELNTHPSGIDMSSLAQDLNYDREVIRVWFCNKRQALKNSVKKFKSNEINEDNESTSSLLMDNNLSDTTNYFKAEQDEILS